jgi:hypothetical protein
MVGAVEHHDDDASCDERQRRRPIGRRSAALVSFAVFATLFTVAALGPFMSSGDTRWSIHTAMSIARGHGGDLTEYRPLLERETADYAIRAHDGRRYTIFPIGVSLLSVPAALIAAVVKPGFNEELKQAFPQRPEKLVAIFFAAAAGLVFFWIVLTRFGSIFIALVATGIFSFGTSMWSTATRALWQHGPMVLMVAIAMLLLLRSRDRPALAQYASLPLAMAFLVRPTAAVPIVVLSLYVLIVHRDWFVRYMGWAALIALPWFAFNLSRFGAVLPDYYLPSRLSGASTYWEALLGNLISPARGLFVFSPILLFAVSGFVLAMRARADRALHAAFAATVLLHLAVVASFPHWWAGHSYGPRFMTDVVPFLVYFVAFNVCALRRLAPCPKAAVSGAMALLAVASVLIHAHGALSRVPSGWNVWPLNVDTMPARVWDWRDLQFTRGIAFINPVAVPASPSPGRPSGAK